MVILALWLWWIHLPFIAYEWSKIACICMEWMWKPFHVGLRPQPMWETFHVGLGPQPMLLDIICSLAVIQDIGQPP